MGSNTFRLVVFRYRPGGSFQLVDEIRDAVRLSGGAGPKGLAPAALDRAAHTTRLYAAFCAASEVDDVVAVATSAVRDAPNREAALAALSADGALDVRILSAEEEAWYGYLGAVNSTTLGDGHVLDLGGGSVQVSQVTGRSLDRVISRPLGAVRMTEAFLPDSRASRAQIKALRRHVERLHRRRRLAEGRRRPDGRGGRHHPHPREHASAPHAVRAGRAARLQPHPRRHRGPDRRDGRAARQAERSALPGLKQDRADITLAGAVVISTILDHMGVEGVEICSQGLREGIFSERLLSPADPPLVADVRRQSVLNLVETYRCDVPHAEHVTALALSVYDELARLGLLTIDRRERELLWAAGMLHDAGVLVDYNDHHKHGFYLVLNAGLPGYRHPELAMIALLVRAHRKALPNTAPLDDIVGPEGADRLARLAACLRVAEQLERGRAGGVREVRLEAHEGIVRLIVEAEGDPTVAVWSAALETPAFQHAFDRRARALGLVPEAPAGPSRRSA